MTPMDTAWQLLKATYRITTQPTEYGPESSSLFSLVDQDNNVLSTLAGEEYGFKAPYSLDDISGKTPEEYRRQGYYGKLLNALIQQGYDIMSDNRNRKSHPFHEKFMSNVPENVDVDYPKNKEFHEETPITYSRKPTARFPNSDLNIRDYGSIPIQSVTREPKQRDKSPMIGHIVTKD